jgi:hypothetical protein
MIHKLSEHLYSKIANYYSKDGKGLHCYSSLSIESLATIIEHNYGLRDLDICDFPNDEDFETPEYYYFEVVDQKKYTWFVLRWG